MQAVSYLVSASDCSTFSSLGNCALLSSAVAASTAASLTVSLQVKPPTLQP